ncbi:MAG: molecular chaperone HtpG [Pseudomonadota bacterium]|nr:molecular chaperone HtpG [Pseudomonadota bacterium]
MTAKTKNFSADVESVRDIVINALYTNDEIFLRELLSNASDALEKRRHAALEDESKSAKLGIEIKFDTDSIEVIDNGIGMDQDDLVKNLGQIAHSGTKALLSKLKEGKDKSQLIGQFGVGFYSSFVVAKEVIVKSKKVGEKTGWVWRTKTSENKYSIEQDDSVEEGTSVKLILKEDKQSQFNSFWSLKNIVTKHSNFIAFPITMYEPPIESEENKKDKKSNDPQPVVVNDAKALWTINKKNISQEQYDQFYQHLSHHDPSPPLLTGDFRVEGKTSFNSIVFIPKEPPFDLWNREMAHGLKLYVQRVFILDQQDAFLPLYLRFIKGMVDSEDLSLNVSREMLQKNAIVNQIKTAITKKIIGLLTDLAKDDKEKYEDFWSKYGSLLKEGVVEDFQNKDALVNLLRFKTSLKDEWVSFAEYKANMKDDQKKIYYITCDHRASANQSPHLEIFNQKGIEVLVLDERIDEWMIGQLNQYEGIDLQSVVHAELDAPEAKDEDKKAKSDNDENDAVLKHVETVLKEQVKSVKASSRLTESPCCLVSESNEMSSHLKRMLEQAGQEVPDAKPILELNMSHPIVKRMVEEQNDAQFANWAKLLMGQAQLMDGENIEHPANFVKLVNELMLVEANSS